MLVKNYQNREAIEFFLLKGNIVYGHTQSYGLNHDLKYFSYNISQGVLKSITYDKLPVYHFSDEFLIFSEDGERNYSPDDSELGRIKSLIEGQLPADKLTQEFRSEGFNLQTVIKLNGGGYKSKSGQFSSWSEFFINNMDDQIDQLAELLKL